MWRSLLAAALAMLPMLANAADRVQFNMSWLPQGSMAGVVVAADKGLYRAADLDVSLIRGFGAIRTANELDQGLFEFGYVDPLAVILNRAHGGHVRMIAPLAARLPAGLCYVEARRRIAAPADLAGLTIGGGQNSPMQALVPVWLKRNGVDPAKVTLLGLDPAVVVSSLIAGRIDAAECWKGNSLPQFRQQAAGEGLAIGMISYADFGFDIPGSGIAATDRLIAEKPDLVRRFVAATLAGYAYAAQHPDEALALITRRYPVLNAEVTRAQIVETAQLQGHGFDPARMARAVDLMRAGGAAAKIEPADIYTVQFLPEP
jgi:NitT/TauT family transport system substrate-binding protein